MNNKTPNERLRKAAKKMNDLIRSSETNPTLVYKDFQEIVIEGIKRLPHGEKRLLFSALYENFDREMNKIPYMS